MLKVKLKGMYGSYMKLKETKKDLRNNIERLRKVSQELSQMSDTEEIRISIKKVIYSLEQEEIKTYKLMLVLEKAMTLYRKAEKNIQEKYEGGVMVYKRYQAVNAELKQIDSVLSRLQVK